MKRKSMMKNFLLKYFFSCYNRKEKMWFRLNNHSGGYENGLFFNTFKCTI